jgi:hypothetical protein
MTSKGRVMKISLKRAIICSLMEELRLRGSWCGEAHVQAATYLLECLAGVPLGLDFRLYKQGPNSFELREELALLRGADLLVLDPQGAYGPKLRVVEKPNASIPDEYKKAISFVAETVGARGVSELEALSTALLVTLEGDEESRQKRLLELKSHIDSSVACKALKEIDQLRQQVRGLASASPA